MLRARLYERELEKREAEANKAAASKTEIGWGHQIRSYVLQPYQLVKDLRTGVTSGTPSDVLDGELDDFMQASLAQRIIAAVRRRSRTSSSCAHAHFLHRKSRNIVEILAIRHDQREAEIERLRGDHSIERAAALRVEFAEQRAIGVGGAAVERQHIQILGEQRDILREPSVIFGGGCAKRFGETDRRDRHVADLERGEPIEHAGKAQRRGDDDIGVEEVARHSASGRRTAAWAA